MMREPSKMVRETAAAQLGERQSDWAYSKPVVLSDLIWNLAFVMVGSVMIVLSKREKPTTPLRVRICGYCLQCALHMVCVCFEYRLHNQRYQQRNSRNAVAHDILTYENARQNTDISSEQSSEDGDLDFLAENVRRSGRSL
ncbi:hypothetical protein KP509_32G032800 [Ceratopteris richardii]|uniref:RING-type E3 ubiquitin transferase n=1 Tax=Ceratopteris richardii TaxID=49495 RepID=A0A8T2QSV8_CERRI|nr:hypothetical protein KP509_32G032800 [Ceratopteris richardii]